MTARHHKGASARPAVAPIHRGPQSMPATPVSPYTHAPNAALLIDFDNVTMGIRSDLGKELRSLLSSDIIKGKVAVQRAYADWRRYPQYIVPLSESSIDLIFAPAYGSSKKNATDIRLAIDALELVFTRPEIGTFILLSGDSDFSSLVIKLKEYGKYVIGVGIRESSSDLLVQNCDEYYSYSSLAGLVRTSEEEVVKRDPWELVTEAITRMKRNGDVLRSDRLKQVMQEIDSTFDEKNFGYSKFSKFCLDAAQRGLLSVTKLENGQYEVDAPAEGARAAAAGRPAGEAAAERPSRPERGAGERERGGRSRRGRGRGRDREAESAARADESGDASPRAQADALAPGDRQAPAAGRPRTPTPPRDEPRRDEPRRDEIGRSGERLTREEAFDLVRRAVQASTRGDDDVVLATAVRGRARELLGRDSESLSERNFVRILQDAHDSDIIDLRRRGDDFEVARSAEAAPVADQLARAEPPARPAAPTRRGTAPRGIGALGRMGRGRQAAAGPPPELLAIGVVDHAPPAGSRVATPPEETGHAHEPDERTGEQMGQDAAKPPAKPTRKRTPAARKKKSSARTTAAKEASADGGGAARAKRPRARKKTAAKTSET